jgi:hypothetical protein
MGKVENSGRIRLGASLVGVDRYEPSAPGTNPKSKLDSLHHIASYST